MARNWIGKNWVLILVITGLATILCLVTWVILVNSRNMASLPISPTSAMVIVPAPTLTPQPTATPYYTQTPTQRPGLPPTTGGIQIGGFVQITGTNGVGLRLRDSAGLNFKSKFLGMDAEVFEVREGPVDADGITWWFLVAPYDENRSGWAASNYLQIVNTQP